MKVYEPVVQDYDLEVSLGLFLKKEVAEQKLKEAKTTEYPTPKQWWFQKYSSQIIERDVIE